MTERAQETIWNAMGIVMAGGAIGIIAIWGIAYIIT